jgi:hypothetical protein
MPGDFVNLKQMESEFVKARTDVFMAAGTARQKIAQLRRIEAQYCRKLATEPRLKLEVRRSIAETLLDMSISRGQTLAPAALGSRGWQNWDTRTRSRRRTIS